MKSAWKITLRPMKAYTIGSWDTRGVWVSADTTLRGEARVRVSFHNADGMTQATFILAPDAAKALGAVLAEAADSTLHARARTRRRRT